MPSALVTMLEKMRCYLRVPLVALSVGKCGALLRLNQSLAWATPLAGLPYAQISFVSSR